MSTAAKNSKRQKGSELTEHFADIADGAEFVLTEASFGVPDEQFLWLSCGCPSLQEVARPLLPPRTGKRGDPFTLACGCNSHGIRCDEEKRLGTALEAARRAWEQLGQEPGDAGFAGAYRPLLRARTNYHAHFRQGYDAREDALWQEHCRMERAQGRAA